MLTALLGALGPMLGPDAEGQAQDLVYRPANPAFGGSPVNHRWLRSSADAQNPFSQAGGFSSFRDDPLANFEENLQRQVLDQLSRQILEDQFGNVNFTEEGSYDFERFSVDVTPGPSGISIQVFNKQTGESTSIEIPRF
jgi:curli production assembly/transport component CsgF